ncbi:MAG: nickel-dependent lactate racemase [Sphaerochaeta sp.]|nr:nickel-dependent lactate racemase [Sphaerochaeta sp.]
MKTKLEVAIPYNKGTFVVSLSDTHLLGIVEPNEVENPKSQQELLATINTPEFHEFLAFPGSLLVIINDGTRPTPTRLLLSAIKGELLEANAKFIIATGAHRGPTEEEYEFIFGSTYEVFKDRVFVHDARCDEAMVYIGTSSNGTKLLLNQLVVNAGKILVIGSVEPHYFAGYTGGRKAFLPGTAAYVSIEQNHKLALSSEATSLALVGNPVHEDMMDAVSLIKTPVYSFMTVLDKNHQLAGLFSGSLSDSFQAAIDSANSVFVTEISQKADIVVTVARYPMDVDLYQAQKAMDNAKLALKDGGTMILIAACREGVGDQAFSNLLSSSDTPEKVLESISREYKLGYHKAAKMAEVFSWATVEILSVLDDKLLESLFFKPIHDLQQALDVAISRHGSVDRPAKVLFLLDGCVNVPKVKDDTDGVMMK